MKGKKTNKYNGKTIEGEGEVRPHAMLKTGARMFLDDAKNNERGRDYNLMASMLFSAFALESYISHLGKRLFNKDWKYFEKLSPMSKLKLLDNKLNLHICFNDRPYSTFNDIFNYRKKLVHAKTETVTEPTITRQNKFPVKFEAKWEKITDINTATRFIVDMNQMIKFLFEKTGLDKMLPEMGGMASWSETTVKK